MKNHNHNDNGSVEQKTLISNITKRNCLELSCTRYSLNMRTIYSYGLNKGFSLKSSESYQLWKTPKKGIIARMFWL